MMRVSLIAAMSEQFLIGTEAGLPWHLPADLKRFRKLTIGKPVIIGRKTLELLGGPLKGRPHIVLTHRADYHRDDSRIAHSIPEALGMAQSLLPETATDEVMVIGGAEVYREAMPWVTRMYLTIVSGTFTGTTYYPFECRPTQEWMLVHEEAVPADERNAYPHRFLIWERGVPSEVLPIGSQ